MNIFKQFWTWMMGPVSKKERESDSARVRHQLVEEIEYARQFAHFMSSVFNMGFAVKITVEVDGVQAPVVVIAHGQEPLVEYMANWAAGQRHKKEARLEDFDKGYPDLWAKVEKKLDADANGADLGERKVDGIQGRDRD